MSRPHDERARVEALRRYGVLDQPPQPDLQALTRVAATLCGAAGAVINLLDKDRQWQAATTGTPPVELPRQLTMCERVLHHGQVTYVRDTLTDDRFVDNPHVTGELAAWRMYASAPLLTPDGHAIGTLCVFDHQPRDLTTPQLDGLRDLAGQVVALFELRYYADQARQAAAHDPLTGLPNRVVLESMMRHALDQTTRTSNEPAALVIDLNGFKKVNDTYGHAAGDAVLREAGSRIRQAVRSSDTPARLAGDEFAVVIDNAPGEALADVTRRVRTALAEPVRYDGLELHVDAAVGGAAADRDDDVASWLARADRAMYADKSAGARTSRDA